MCQTVLLTRQTTSKVLLAWLVDLTRPKINSKNILFFFFLKNSSTLPLPYQIRLLSRFKLLSGNMDSLPNLNSSSVVIRNVSLSGACFMLLHRSAAPFPCGEDRGTTIRLCRYCLSGLCITANAPCPLERSKRVDLHGCMIQGFPAITHPTALPLNTNSNWSSCQI